MTASWPSLENSIKELNLLNYHEQWNYPGLVRLLLSLASAISRAPRNELRELTAQFHNVAGRIPYPDDCDIGALILESEGDSSQHNEMKLYLYEEAAYRAEWCASSGTSGGECIARSRHLSKINEKRAKIA